MKTKTKFILGAVFIVLFVVILVGVRVFDVAAIGENGTEVGFSAVNGAFHELTGVNMVWYEITDVFGILAILVCAGFGFLGFIQLVKRKKLFDVDGEILSLGVLYIVTMAFYFSFLNIPVCYRPIIMPGESVLEPSFPSSHTMLVIVVMISAIMMVDKYIKQKFFCNLIKFDCAVFCAVTVVGRLISGVHWLTDIVGAVVISAGLLMIFSAVLSILKKSGR